MRLTKSALFGLALMTVPLLAAPAAAQTATAAARLQLLEDRDALRSLAYHYGRGNDELSIHLGDRAKGRELAAAEYARSFAPDIEIEVFALGSPLRQVKGIAAWVDFADGFFKAKNYSSSLHLMSNFDISFIDADTARVNAYVGVPHFIRSAAKDQRSADTIVEYMLCRYDYVARRQRDGSWRIAKLRIDLEEIASTPGFYAGGQGKGL